MGDAGEGVLPENGTFAELCGVFFKYLVCFPEKMMYDTLTFITILASYRKYQILLSSTLLLCSVFGEKWTYSNGHIFFLFPFFATFSPTVKLRYLGNSWADFYEI